MLPALPENDTGHLPQADQPVRRSRAEQARLNGAKSRGPKTVDGKARSSRNALRHGLTARVHMVLESEDLDAFTGLGQRVLDEIAPVGEIETFLAARLAAAMWKTARAERIEASAFTGRHDVNDARLALALRYHGHTNREFFRTLRALRDLKENPLNSPPSPEAEEDGLNPPLPPDAEEDRKSVLGQAPARPGNEGDSSASSAPYNTPDPATAHLAWGGAVPPPPPPPPPRPAWRVLRPVGSLHPLMWSRFQDIANPNAAPVLVGADGSVKPIPSKIPADWNARFDEDEPEKPLNPAVWGYRPENPLSPPALERRNEPDEPEDEPSPPLVNPIPCEKESESYADPSAARNPLPRAGEGRVRVPLPSGSLPSVGNTPPIAKDQQHIPSPPPSAPVSTQPVSPAARARARASFWQAALWRGHQPDQPTPRQET